MVHQSIKIKSILTTIWVDSDLSDNSYLFKLWKHYLIASFATTWSQLEFSLECSYRVLLVVSYYWHKRIDTGNNKQDYNIINTCTSFQGKKVPQILEKIAHKWPYGKTPRRGLDGTAQDWSLLLIAIPNCVANFCWGSKQLSCRERRI